MADQCASIYDRPIMAYAAIFGSEFTVIQSKGTPFIFLEGLKPKHWQDPDGSLYRLTVQWPRIRFTLVQECERLRFLPFETESPPVFYIFIRNPLFNTILQALNQLYHEHQTAEPNAKEAFQIRAPRVGEC